MKPYGPLAPIYDDLTADVPYGELSAFYEGLLGVARGGTILDLCCGTGTLTCLFASRGYEMLGADMSGEMLCAAQEKAAALREVVPPMFLCQSAAELDLYGTVDGAFCSLDAVNYIPAKDFTKMLARLHLFIVPGGFFAFDIHSPEHLKSLDGEIFVDEGKGLLCLWRAQFDEAENALFYGMDIFSQDGKAWQREQEEHVEYAHCPERLCQMLEAAGFCDCEIIKTGPQGEMGRLFIRAKNTAH